MKNSETITLYTVDMDGTYSTVIKVEVPKTTGEYWLRSKSETYFRTFGEAKKQLIEKVEYLAYEWKNCLKNAKSISRKDIM